MPETTYTYRAGEKLVLEKRPDQFVARAQPDELRRIGIADAERVSPASYRVTIRADELETLMARSRELAPTHHAYAVHETGEEFLITDRIFVTFKDALPLERVAEFAGKYGLRQLEAYSDRDYLFELTNHTGMNPVKLVVKLTEEEPLVAAAENDLNYRAEKQAITLPIDPDYFRQWHLHPHFNHPEVDPRAHVNCEAAWQLLDSFGAPEVVVGVTDDGCKLDHPDFDSPGKFAGWGYFEGTRLVTNRDIDGLQSRMYQTGANHGTSCAGVIGGEADAILTVGAAPGCRLLPIKWESQGRFLLISDSKLLTALTFISDQVDVLSNSWGNTPTSLSSGQVIRRLAELAQTGGRRGRGIVFLWAAGNENCPIQHTSPVAIPYTDGWEFQNSWVWAGVETARTFRNNRVGIPGVMHVAALASTAQRSHYSNYGTGISVCAPSSNSHAFWRMQVRGLGITTTTGQSGNVTEEFGGTSSATPLTAGIAALVISANPNLTALEVVSILQRTAAKDLNLQGYPRTPAANYDPDTSWDVSPVNPFDFGDFQDIGHPDGTWSPWFGHGRVDASAAVTAALGSNGTPPAPVPAPAPEKFSSNPSATIPDNSSAGVEDAININRDGIVTFIKIGVAITHTFIGDLRVTLIAPSGKFVHLHDRTGGNTQNLQRTYESTSTPALQVFHGEPVRGAWTLRVQDLAPIDRGKLQSWELEFGLQLDEIIEANESPGATIPDSSPAGIERSLTLHGAGAVRDLELNVDISHTYIGDLIVSLRSPTGSTAVLHQRSGGSAQNLVASFSSVMVPVLQVFRGEAMAGQWHLHVADHEAADVGKLNRWGLRIIKHATPTPSSAKSRAAKRTGASKPAQRSKASQRSKPSAYTAKSKHQPAKRPARQRASSQRAQRKRA